MGARKLISGVIDQLNARQVFPYQGHRQFNADDAGRCNEDLVCIYTKFCGGQPHGLTRVCQALFADRAVGAAAVRHDAVNLLASVDQLAREGDGRGKDAVLAVGAGRGARSLGEQEPEVELVGAGRLDARVHASGRESGRRSHVFHLQ